MIRTLKIGLYFMIQNKLLNTFVLYSKYNLAYDTPAYGKGPVLFNREIFKTIKSMLLSCYCIVIHLIDYKVIN